MRYAIFVFLILSHFIGKGNAPDPLEQVFLHFKSLEFGKAKNNIVQIKSKALAAELETLNDMFYFGGQKDSTYFKTTKNNAVGGNTVLDCIKLLNKGYYALYYHKTKSGAFGFFYKALKMAKTLESIMLQKASLLALLEYYRLEIAQNSTDQEKYLEEYKVLVTDGVDAIRIRLYELIFLTKNLGALNERYFTLADTLTDFENDVATPTRLLPKIYFEKGLRLELEDKLDKATEYYEKALKWSNGYPFLQETRFFSLIRLSGIAQKKSRFSEALQMVHKARGHLNLADTLRSNYYLNLYASFYLNDLKKSDSAYVLLKKAFVAGYQLDYRTNALEVNRLNVILETQQKELENTLLKQGRAGLLVALFVLVLLLAISYLAYKNSISKKGVLEKEKELQAQKLEKVLKDQELMGLDAMIEGQEKERQRIANDLHDNLGSLLATLKLHFQNLKIKKDRIEEEQDALFQKTDDLIEEAYQKVRSMAHAKNAGVNAQEGLLPAVKNFAYKISVLNKLAILVEDHGMGERLENSLEITVFRIIQELITNVIKHASATEVTVSLTHHGESINLIVEDNGIGFEISKIQAKDGMGLHSIQKRIENLGGQVTIDSVKNKGTTIILDIPIT